MFFLVRAAFWLAIVVMILPGDSKSGQDAPRVTAFEAITAARSAVEDLSQFCGRNPEACETGGNALHVFADKVRYSAQMLYGYFNSEAPAGGDTGRGTLKPEDVAPAWHGRAADKPA
jgi:hypothetical protein